MMTIDNRVADVFSRRMAIQSVAALLLGSTVGVAQAQLPMSTAFNRAARNRILSQRLAKTYCQLLLGSVARVFGQNIGRCAPTGAHGI